MTRENIPVYVFPAHLCGGGLEKPILKSILCPVHEEGRKERGAALSPSCIDQANFLATSYQSKSALLCENGDFHTEVAFSTESSFHFKCYLAAQKYQSAATGQTAELCNLALILITDPVELGPKMCCHVIFSSGLSILSDIDGDKVACLDPR